MAFTQEDKQKMDDAAADADNELDGIVDSFVTGSDKLTLADSLAAIATWWKRWYPHAGHKRLARVLLQYAPKED